MAFNNKNIKAKPRGEGQARVITQKKSLIGMVKGILSKNSKFKEKDLIDAQKKVEKYDSEVQKIIEPYMTPGNEFLTFKEIGSRLSPKVISKLEDNLWNLTKLDPITEEVEVHQEKIALWYCELLGIKLPSEEERQYFQDPYVQSQAYLRLAKLKKELREKYYK